MTAEPSTGPAPAAPDPAAPRRLHLGELLIDLVIVAGSALYVRAAGHYPPQGRQIPLVVGWLAIGLGALHLVGHAVPALWSVTHDSAARGVRPGAKARKEVTRHVTAAEAGATAVDAAGAAAVAVSGVAPAGAAGVAATEVDAAAGTDPAAGAPGAVTAPVVPTGLKTSYGDPRQVLLAIAWAVGLLAGIYLLGFTVALPVFFLAYFGALRAWRTAVISAVVMWALAEGLFEYALSVPLPQGLLW